MTVKIKHKTLNTARSCLFSFTLCKVNDQKVDFFNTVNDLKKKQDQRKKKKKKKYFSVFWAFTLHIQKKLAQGLTLQYE